MSLKEKIMSKKNYLMGACTGVVASALTTVTAFAADEDITSIQTSLSTGFTDCKTQFVTILGTVVVAAMAIFALKFAVSQGVAFFSKMAHK